MDKRLVQIYASSKEGKSYLMDRDTFEIYVQSVNIKKMTKTGTSVGVIGVMLGLPVIGFLLTPLRPHFYLDVHNYVILAMVGLMLFAQILLGLFFEKIVNSKILKKKIQKKVEYANEKLKSYGSTDFELVALNAKEKRDLIKKSCFQKFYLMVITAFVWVILAPIFMNEFIKYSNLMSYFWFSIISLVLLTPVIIVARFFVMVFRIALKDYIFPKK